MNKSEELAKKIERQQALEDLRRRAAKGGRIRQLFAHKGWADVAALIDGKIAETPSAMRWNPGMSGKAAAPIEIIALTCAYNGGYADFAEQLISQLKSWEEDGRQAEEEITKRSNKS